LTQSPATFKYLNQHGACGMTLDGQFNTVDNGPLEEYAKGWDGYTHTTITGSGAILFEFFIERIAWEGRIGHIAEHYDLAFFDAAEAPPGSPPALGLLAWL